MQADTFTLSTPDGARLHVHRWTPDAGAGPRAVVQLAHGMAEHSARYARFAEALTAAGYAVYAHDHRGHGRTAEAGGEQGHFGDDTSFDTIVDDLALVTDRAEEEYPGLPLVLLGHSMGSFLARAYAARYGERLRALVLSGTASDPGALGRAGLVIARIEGRLRGRAAKSPLMTKLVFGSYNRAFAPNRTDFDWLSRDDAEVDAYLADEWCGQVSSAGFFQELLAGLVAVNRDDVVSGVRTDLPILLVSGDKDPVGADGAGVRRVADQFRQHGVTDVTLTLYAGARHEILNETNRDEVTADIIAWLDAHVGG